MKNFKLLVLLTIIPVLLTGCGRDAYYQAIKEQNITMQLRMENERLVREDKQNRHDEKMVILIEKMAVTTGATENTNDDFLASMMLMMTQDKSNMVDLAEVLTSGNSKQQLQVIEAPDSIGDVIQKSTGLIIGGAGIALGIVQSNNMAKVASDGIKNAGTSVSGSGNVMALEGSSLPITIAPVGDGASGTFAPQTSGPSTNTSTTSTIKK